MVVDIYNTDKKYNIIYADPPWAYSDKRKGKKMSGGASNHYKTMKINDIRNMGETIKKLLLMIVCYFYGRHFLI